MEKASSNKQYTYPLDGISFKFVNSISCCDRPTGGCGGWMANVGIGDGTSILFVWVSTALV